MQGAVRRHGGAARRPFDEEHHRARGTHQDGEAFSVDLDELLLACGSLFFWPPKSPAQPLSILSTQVSAISVSHISSFLLNKTGIERKILKSSAPQGACFLKLVVSFLLKSICKVSLCVTVTALSNHPQVSIRVGFPRSSYTELERRRKTCGAFARARAARPFTLLTSTSGWTCRQRLGRTGSS